MKAQNMLYLNEKLKLNIFILISGAHVLLHKHDLVEFKEELLAIVWLRLDLGLVDRLPDVGTARNIGLLVHPINQEEQNLISFLVMQQPLPTQRERIDRTPEKKVKAEVMENSHVPPRPFRVNAGAVHAYVLTPEGKTKYLEELRSGEEVEIWN